MADVDIVRAKLEANLKARIAYAVKRALVWGSTYYVSRTLLIGLSAFASAKAVGGIEFDIWQGYSALAVTILTALDTWLKPRDYYRVHYEFDDEYRRLQSELDSIPLRDDDELKKINRVVGELEKIRERYRKAQFSI